MASKMLAAALASVGLLSGAAFADEGPFMVRARAVYVDFANGQNGMAARVEADSRWIPEVDLSYFFTPNIAAELVLTYPQDIDIKVNGTKQGTIKALPPSLMLQYHFTQLGAFKPYVGLGLNYTFFTKRKNILNGAGEVDGSSVGPAAQVGFDYMLNKNWSLNLDVKYIKMDTEVKVGGSRLGTLDLDPITAGIGVGYRF